MSERVSPSAWVRLRRETDRIVSVEEAREYLETPITPEERATALALIAWFQRRYPTPMERLAYVRGAHARWRRGFE